MKVRYVAMNKHLWIKTNLLNINIDNIAIIQISFAIFHGNPQWLWLTPLDVLVNPLDVAQLPGHPSLPAHFGGALGRLQFCGGKRGAGLSKHGAGPENVEAQEKIGDFMWM